MLSDDRFEEIKEWVNHSTMGFGKRVMLKDLLASFEIQQARIQRLERVREAAKKCDSWLEAEYKPGVSFPHEAFDELHECLKACDSQDGEGSGE